MTTVMIEITHPPFGHEKAFAALYVATASLSKGMDVIVVLRGDGVYLARHGQVDPLKNINLPPTEDQVRDILELDGRVLADEGALDMRGIEPDELIDGVECMGPDAIQGVVLDEGDKILTF